MGCEIESGEDFVKIQSNGKLKGVEVNLSNAPDLILFAAPRLSCKW